ncbi:MAG: phosphoenolpyruvate synthase, partial [Candidatus Magasanikbacteria bacterium]|nr:phosphoenolpyruvate synthase [Candidatus Magasanikbacteria bacterium]
TKNILWFKEIEIKDVPLVGGKNASLGEMYSKLTVKGISVPNGFAITAKAYRDFLVHAKLTEKIKKNLKGLNVADVKALSQAGKKIREAILSATFSHDLIAEIKKSYQELAKSVSVHDVSVAVRSSATAEDLPDASFAGQQETYLNVKGEKELLIAVKKCVASLFTDRAISYREAKGFDHMSVALSVTVQQMVRSDLGASGVMFTLDTESGFPGVVLINAAYGLGEYVVKGRVTPDQFYVFKDGVKQGKKAIISRILGSKEVKLIYGKKQGTTQAQVKQGERDKFAISADDAVKLAKWGVQIEEHYNRPQDIEWAKDGQTGRLFIVQARPETVKARASHSVIENYQLKKRGKVLVSGIAIGQKIGAGKARAIDEPRDMKQFKKGEILVTRVTDPDWEPIMRLAAAIVTEQGGKTSHAAIVSRELGVPCLVGAKDARQVLKTGIKATVSCSEGDEGFVYAGILPFEVKKTEIKSISKTKTKIMMNVGDPDNAFSLSFLPNDGVGLAREEFIFSNFIRIHPLALIHFNKLKDRAAKRKIAALTRGYKKKEDYCVDKLAEGIGRIAAAFYPRDVIVRLSDFKTNEYATLIGGKEFEPKEENPMLGWRGASRYYSKEYKEAFRLECEAIKKARDEWGLKNIIVMVPFCRTSEEGEKVLSIMADYGLKRGENGLQVYVMCEIPSNVILAEDFAKIFDGFSIGSNDLTQLTLGVDRDSSLVSHVYDEKNKAVTTLIRQVIHMAHKYKRKVGICGQAPSDYPEFAEFLVREGIDSISLNPDTVVSTRERIAFVEKTLGKMGRKTSGKFLGLVVWFGLLGAMFISLGAGCSLVNNKQTPKDSLSYASSSELRKKVVEMKDKEFDAKTVLLKESSFANFTMQYPAAWTVEHWNGGVAVKSSDTGEYVSVFRQLVKPPIKQSDKGAISVDGQPATITMVGATKGGLLTAIYEITLEDEDIVLEIDVALMENNDKIIKSFKFLEEQTSSAPNKWDVLEKRLCVQMITYARKNKSSECEMFPTPCDVPKLWDVCGE